MERLDGVTEFLDGPLLDAAALRGNLRDLRRVNHLLGGIDLSRRGIAHLLGPARERGASAPVRILDVGTGAADIPRALLEKPPAGAPVELTAIDSRAEVLEAARSLDPGLTRLRGLTLRLADGRSLPDADGAFDIAHASLVLHHLEPDGAIALLREMRRVARHGVVVNDLARGRVWVALARLLALLTTRNPYTRHDGPMSVRRAYTLEEARSLFETAGLRVTWAGRGPLGHRWAIAAVPATPAAERA